MELAGLGSKQPYASRRYMSSREYTAYTINSTPWKKRCVMWFRFGGLPSASAHEFGVRLVLKSIHHCI
jgi:hypothetical protein